MTTVTPIGTSQGKIVFSYELKKVKIKVSGNTRSCIVRSCMYVVPRQPNKMNSHKIQI